MRQWAVIGAIVGVGCVALAAFVMMRGEGTFAASIPVEGCPADLFDRKADVFDAMRICATPKVSEEKLRHAAAVAAEWIDNDGDGVADEPRVLAALKSRPAILVMSAQGFNALGYSKIMPAIEALGGVGQDLSAEETARKGGRDASQEEIHHLLIAAGWKTAFPDEFSEVEDDNSALFQQWSLADAKGYYAYNDPTCDNSCKAMEFVYLSTAAYLGSAIDVQSDEMRVRTRAALREKLPGMVALFESTDYHYPKHVWPDGQYDHAEHIKFTLPE